MHTRRRVPAAIAAVAALLLTACSEEPKAPAIRIGTIFPMTGEMSNTGNENVEVAVLAAEQINASGGVLGRPLELLHRDDATLDEQSGELALQLAHEGVVAVVGSSFSSSTLAAADQLIAANIVQISPAATSPALTTKSDNGLFFRTCAPDTLQGRLLAKRARAKGFEKVAVLHLPDSYGVGLADAFALRFAELGGTVTQKRPFEEKQASYAALVADILSDGPAAVLLVGYPEDSAQIMRDYLAAHEATGTFWFFGDALQDKGFIDTLGAETFTFDHEGTGPGTPSGERFDAYVRGYKARYGRNPAVGTYSENVYDAVYLLALALEAAGKAEGGPSLATALTAVSKGGTSVTADGFADAVAAIRRGEDIDYWGASGPVDFDGAGDVVTTYNIWDVRLGTFHLKEQGLSP